MGSPRSIKIKRGKIVWKTRGKVVRRTCRQECMQLCVQRATVMGIAGWGITKES